VAVCSVQCATCEPALCVTCLPTLLVGFWARIYHCAQPDTLYKDTRGGLTRSLSLLFYSLFIYIIGGKKRPGGNRRLLFTEKPVLLTLDLVPHHHFACGQDEPNDRQASALKSVQ